MARRREAGEWAVEPEHVLYIADVCLDRTTEAWPRHASTEREDTDLPEKVSRNGSSHLRAVAAYAPVIAAASHRRLAQGQQVVRQRSLEAHLGC